MRMNLGELAFSLGCGPGRVLWNTPVPPCRSGPAGDASPASAGEADRQCAKGAPSLWRELSAPVNNCWETAPWSEIIPSGAQVDSRKIKPGNLFFCLPGERVDGHDFARNAADAGAGAIVASRDPFVLESGEHDSGFAHPPVFLVDDVRLALWRIAICHRDTSLARVIGVTGSAGKTSVKEVLAQVLAVHGFTERNHLNLNNQIGLPLSMLNASADASFWVMELGISEAGDMDELGAILRPDTGLILNVGDAHTLGLGAQGVAVSKAALLRYIQTSGLAVVSLDYPDLNAEMENHQPDLQRRAVHCLRFSTTRPEADCRAEYLGPGPGGGGRYRIHADSAVFTFETPFRGDFASENVAAIAAVAIAHGLRLQEIEYGFSLATLPPRRFFTRHYGPFILLDDCYNANPLSANRMVKAAAGLAEEHGRPLVLVMGEMLELGDKAESAHYSLGNTMALAAPVLVFWKGGHGDAVSRGLRDGGYRGEFHPVGDAREFALLLDQLAPGEGLFLFKGSRGNRLEHLVEAFRSRVDPGAKDGGPDAL